MIAALLILTALAVGIVVMVSTAVLVFAPALKRRDAAAHLMEHAA